MKDESSMKSEIDSWQRPLFDDVIRRIRVRSGEYYRPEFSAPWAVSVSRKCSLFHIVRRGKCQLEIPSVKEPILLHEGDCAIAVRGDAHVIGTGPAARVVNFFDLVNAHEGRMAGPIRFGGQGVSTRMLCGGAAFETGVRNPLLSILPPIIHIKGNQGDGNDWLALTTQNISDELDRGSSGSRAVINRLTDILFIRAVNAYFDRNMETAESGWLAAVRDEQIGRALLMLHQQPQRAWRVDLIARRVGLSRSGFAARFRELVGEPPLQYLTRLRINSAALRLRATDEKLRSIASAVGYSSVPSFVKSFKRLMDATPGEYRQHDNHGS
jgi:AraC family transcriptional regulator, alkane utilization regulator